MPKFGMSIYCISRKIVSGEITTVEAYLKLCEYGAEAVELVPFGFNIAQDPELIEKFKEAYAKTGVPFTNYSLNGNFLGLTSEEFDAENTHLLDLCRIVNYHRLELLGHRSLHLPTSSDSLLVCFTRRTSRSRKSDYLEIGVVLKQSQKALADHTCRADNANLHLFHSNTSKNKFYIY